MQSYVIDRHEIRRLRKARHESVEQAARGMGISMWTLSHIERGIRTPSLATLFLLAENYGVHPGELITDAEDAA